MLISCFRTVALQSFAMRVITEYHYKWPTFRVQRGWGEEEGIAVGLALRQQGKVLLPMSSFQEESHVPVIPGAAPFFEVRDMKLNASSHACIVDMTDRHFILTLDTDLYHIATHSYQTTDRC